MERNTRNGKGGKNMNSIIFDIDGTICPIKNSNEEYSDLIPYKEMIDKIHELKKKGYRIVLFTSRNMRTYNGDISLILKNTKPVLEKWLKKWNIEYDELIFGKPWPGPSGFYVDDRTLRPKELLTKTSKEIDELFRNGRL